MSESESSGAREFRWKVTAFVDGVMTLDERVLRYKQGVYKAQVPLRNIRAFGLRRRARGLAGVQTSELVLRTEPAPGQFRPVKLAIDPEAPGALDALAALRARLPADADVTALPWTEAAPRLGVPAWAWSDALLNKWGQRGLVLVAGAAGVNIVETMFFPSRDPAALRTRLVITGVLLLVGFVLLGIGVRQSRAPRA